MKYLITLYLILSSITTHAQTNEILISDNTEQTYYLIKNTLRESLYGNENGKFIECWVKSISKKSIVVDKKTYTNTYQMTKQLINCYNSQFKILEIVTYNKNGVPIKTSKFDEYSEFMNAIPESTGGQIVEGICENK